MASEPCAASKKASREASGWFVSLQDDPDDLALRRRFEAWLKADPGHLAAWSETLRTSSLAESLLPFDARDWQRPAARPRRRWIMPVAMAAVAACLLWLAAPAVLLRLQSDYTTGTAQVQDIELQDGSMVTLAPASAITIAYTAGERQVRLLSGEAFFAVKPNAERPFRVVARTVEASVLGTSFDVKLERHDVDVSVREGKVRVQATGATETLEEGQSVRVAIAGGMAPKRARSPQTIATWRQGQLVMEDEPLSTAVDQLDRYFDGTIILASASLGERPVTGVFDLREPEDALRAMAKVLGIKVRKVTPWLLVVSAS